MNWKDGMIGRHKTKGSLYVVIARNAVDKESGKSMAIYTSMPLEDFLNNNKIMMNLLEPVQNLEPLGELQEILYD